MTTGLDLLHDPALNKGTAFTYEERRRLGLVGLLPPHVSSMEQQCLRVLENIRARATGLEKYVEMISLLDRNETLFYRVVMENIEEMTRLNERPIVFALSNPTSHSECTAEEAYHWSRGKAVFASGSPFPPVTFEGRTFVPGQANNAYVFPGVGLGVAVSGASRVTDEMFLRAARVLAGMCTDEDLALGRLFPPLSNIREVSTRIAAEVAQAAHDRGLAAEPRPKDMLALVRERQYVPRYRTYD
jgi:malic enzyme